MSDIDFNARIGRLNERVTAIWGEILDTSELVRAIRGGSVDKALYAIYMLETYHYTAHNARNQALVGVRHAELAPYAKFCFEHAAEEVGHEKMALHDVMSIGLKDHKFDIPQPLPSTEILIAYLYWVSFTGNPLQRLGYSYWAENAYEYINPLIDRLRTTLELQESQLTFFIAHSDIDADHFEEIKTIMRRTCKSEQDWVDVERVMETSLRLTGAMLEEVHREYELYRSGKSRRYAFLDVLREAPALAEA
ncbi:iron-containing redox enzyme family protein [Lysobacter sp. CA199]|uniref:iron-containing redox enzyme family protein n=1 Tax=Lysobacter sp. CA199 TaxID=3455608 RepID=UPI003F8D1B83